MNHAKSVKTFVQRQIINAWCMYDWGSSAFSTTIEAAVLPVFFGQADACVVDASSFQVMCELNPQIGKILEVERHSQPYLETVICIHDRFERNRETLIEGLRGLHEEANGRQILLVFKIARLVPFYVDAVESVRELHPARTGMEVAAR